MSNQTTLREAENKVVLEGVLLEVRHTEWKSGQGLNIELDIEVAENEVHTITGMSKFKKDDGSDNGIAKGYRTIIDEYKSVASHGREGADKVRVTQGQIGVNEYFGQDGMLRSFPQLSTKFVNRLQASEELDPKAEFEVEAVVKSVRDEFKNEEETGRAIVDVYIPLFSGKIIPFSFVVADEGAVDYIRDNYEAGSTVKVYGDIINHVEVKESEEATAFGKPKKKVTRKTIREYVITGGSEPYDEESAKVYDKELIKAALTEREVQLEQLKNKKNEDKPKEEKKGFDTKATSKKPVVTNDDLPF